MRLCGTGFTPLQPEVRPRALLICWVDISPDSRAGAGVSYLYLSNIVGSTLGSFLVGFVLMDVLSLKQLSIALALGGVGLGAALLVGVKNSRRLLVLASGAAVMLLIVFSAG